MEILQETSTRCSMGKEKWRGSPKVEKCLSSNPMTSSRQKRRQVSESPSASKRSRHVDGGHETLIKSCDIDSRIRMIFPQDDVIHKPCMSARLFACFTLVSEKSSSIESNGQHASRLTRRGHSSKLPILRLLQALVHVESSSLGRMVEKKTVQFAAYEGSATRPPRDSVLGSHVPRHININAMVTALELINNLLSQSDNDKNEALKSLGALSSFLSRLANPDEGNSMRLVCAKSMPFHWVPQRFQMAAKLYQNDIEKICHCLETNTTLKQAEVHLNLEKKLADSIGRAIRYHLRRFFNSIYGRVTEDPDIAEAPFRRQSRIHEKLKMTFPSWYDAGPYSAVTEGSVSSVFSLALETIEREFGIDAFLDVDFKIPTIPEGFCQSIVSQRGLGTRTKASLSEGDIQTVVSETRAAQGFLAGAKACRFITELLHWPGVDGEISRLGGWGIIEQCAKEFRTLHLERLSPHDSYFVLLSNVKVLRDRTQQCYEAMKQSLNECTDALNEQWVRFECDNAKKLNAVPIVRILRDLLLDGLKAHMFPNIEEPDDVENDLALSTMNDSHDRDDDDDKENY